MDTTDCSENERLINHADVSSVTYTVDKSNGLTQNRGMTNREESVERVLPDSANVVVSYSDGYSGKYAIGVVYNDAYWIVAGDYGSCVGCDRFLADKKATTKEILRDARQFESIQALCRWVRRMQGRVWNGLYHNKTGDVVNDVVRQLINETQ